MIVPNFVSMGCALNGVPLEYGDTVSKNLITLPLLGRTVKLPEFRGEPGASVSVTVRCWLALVAR